jgi:hypothetical protein
MNVSVFLVVGEGGIWSLGGQKVDQPNSEKNCGKIKGKRKNPSIFMGNPLKYTK